MEYQLSITRELGTDKKGRMLRSPVTHIFVETDLGRHLSSGFPPSFIGRLKDVSFGQILDLKFSPGIEAIFRGSAYKFEEIAKDGSFILRRC